MGPEDAPQDAQYHLIVHQRECPCGDGNNRFAEFKDGCRVDVYPMAPLEFDGYIQVPDNEPEGEDLGPCCGYWCLNCPYTEDFDRSITD